MSKRKIQAILVNANEANVQLSGGSIGLVQTTEGGAQTTEEIIRPTRSTKRKINDNSRNNHKAKHAKESHDGEISDYASTTSDSNTDEDQIRTKRKHKDNIGNKAKRAKESHDREISDEDSITTADITDEDRTQVDIFAFYELNEGYFQETETDLSSEDTRTETNTDGEISVNDDGYFQEENYSSDDDATQDGAYNFAPDGFDIEDQMILSSPAPSSSRIPGSAMDISPAPFGFGTPGSAMQVSPAPFNFGTPGSEMQVSPAPFNFETPGSAMQVSPAQNIVRTPGSAMDMSPVRNNLFTGYRNGIAETPETPDSLVVSDTPGSVDSLEGMRFIHTNQELALGRAVERLNFHEDEAADGINIAAIEENYESYYYGIAPQVSLPQVVYMLGVMLIGVIGGLEGCQDFTNI